MLNQLVISKNETQNNKKRRNLLAVTTILVTILSVFALISSLFSQNLVVGQDNLNLSTIVAPPIIEKQPLPETDKNEKPQKNSVKKEANQLPTRQKVIQRISESPQTAPKEISTTPSKFKARPNSAFILNPNGPDTDGKISKHPTFNRGNATAENGKGLEKPSTPIQNKSESKKTVTKTPLPKPPPIKKPEKKTKIISKGVVNGKATYLAKPTYSSIAKAVGAKGAVKIQVVIDENGRVISARAVSGHKFLVKEALKAARASKFSPTTLSGVRVKVQGVIIYNFKG